jgi:cytoskeletal protein CcmA (bactofilin family)
VALAVAVAVAFVVVLLSVAAISQSVNSITQSAIGNKQVDSTDAAEAGIQYEIGQINAQAAAAGTTFTCPGRTTLATSGAITPSYTVQYASMATPSGPTSATAATLQSQLGNGTTVGANCTSTAVTLQGGYTYLIASTGTTTAQTVGATTEEAEVYIPSGVTYAPSTSYHEALYAGLALLGYGNFSLTGGDTYVGSVSACSTGWSFGGNYYSGGSVASLLGISLTIPTIFTGPCSVAGNLYMNNGIALTITGGSGVGKSVYGSGLVTIAGGAGVGGDLWANGLVTLNSGSVVGGSIYSTGGLTMLGTPVVKGSIYATGPVTVSGTVTGSIYANGPVTVSAGASVGGTIYSTSTVTVTAASVHAVQASLSITYLLPTSAGAATAPLIVGCSSSCTYASPSLPTAQFGSSGTLATTASSINAQMVNAANAANNTPSGTSSAVPFPIYSYDAGSWQSNIGFCSATVTCANSSPGLRVLTFTGTSSNNVCGINTVQSNGQTVLDPNSLWGAVASMEVAGAPPTVIQTNCQFTWGDSALKGYSLPLCNSLAIFDSAGFTLPSTFTGFSSGTCGSATPAKHQLYLVVPATNSPPTDGANTLPLVQSLLNPNQFPAGEATCNLVTGPDIDFDQPLTDSGDNISDFLYTPSNVCAYGGTDTIYGQVYAGATVGSTSNWNQTFANISPFVSQAAAGQGATLAGTPTVEWIRSAANPAGTT